MADLNKLKENLEKKGYKVSCFDTAEEAVSYLDGAIDGKSVGFGGSMTLKAIGISEALAKHNEVIWHWEQDVKTALTKAVSADYYLTSVNAIAETGEIVNMDHAGNRVSAMAYGHDKIFFVVGSNKVVPTYEDAVYRCRNVAGPKRAASMGMKTPCAVKQDRCYDCDSPDRICNAFLTLFLPPVGREAEVILIDEELGM